MECKEVPADARVESVSLPARGPARWRAAAGRRGCGRGCGTRRDSVGAAELERAQIGERQPGRDDRLVGRDIRGPRPLDEQRHVAERHARTERGEPERRPSSPTSSQTVTVPDRRRKTASERSPSRRIVLPAGCSGTSARLAMAASCSSSRPRRSSCAPRSVPHGDARAGCRARPRAAGSRTTRVPRRRSRAAASRPRAEATRLGAFEAARGRARAGRRAERRAERRDERRPRPHRRAPTRRRSSTTYSTSSRSETIGFERDLGRREVEIALQLVDDDAVRVLARGSGRRCRQRCRLDRNSSPR